MTPRDAAKLGRARSAGVLRGRRRLFLAAATVALASCGGSSNTASIPAPAVGGEPAREDTRFEPACVDLESEGKADPTDDPRLETLRPLGDEPVVQVMLPRVVSSDADADRLRPRVVRVAGGMLVSVNQFVDVNESFGALFTVDADGGIRWRRCLEPFPDVIAVGQGSDIDAFLVGWTTIGADGSVTRRFEVWSLAHGRMTRTWDDLLDANGISGGATRFGRIHRLEDSSTMVFGPSEERDIQASDSMLVLDLSTWSMRTIPYPPDAIGTPLDLIDLGVDADGSLIELEFGSGVPGGRVRAVESSGKWSSEPQDLNSSIGLRVDFLLGESTSILAGFDSQGRVIWSRDDVFDIQAEGFRAGVDGDVALVSACSGPSSGEVWCPGPKLMAVDVATGTTLWQRNGRWAVSVIGDGRAIVSGPYTDETVTAPPPWEMIDLSTGDRASSTVWNAPWGFSVGCCDSPEEAWAAGGVVFTVDADSIDMWYPWDVSTALRRVGIDSGHR